MPDTSNPAGSPVIHDLTPKPQPAPNENTQQDPHFEGDLKQNLAPTEPRPS